MRQPSGVRFDFNLASDAPGWADPVLEIDGHEVKMTAAWSSDALGDLLNALLVLLNGGSEARCVWQQEPGHWIWELWRRDTATVQVQILRHADAFLSQVPADEPELRLEGDVPIVEFVGAVASGARRCLEEVGRDGFERRWSAHPFPALQLDVLETWVASTGEAFTSA